jgi:hypothetical protein
VENNFTIEQENAIKAEHPWLKGVSVVKK